MEGVHAECIRANQPTKHNLDNLGLAKMNEPNNTLALHESGFNGPGLPG